MLIVNVVPSPGFDSKETVPFIEARILLTMASPKPIPLLFVVKLGEKIFSACSSVIPTPLSVIATLQ
jgi:hypothetical protein